MAGSISVTSRLAALLRSETGGVVNDIDRPEGIVVWIHMPKDAPTGPIAELCRTLSRKIEGSTCLLTMPAPVDSRSCENAIVRALPSEQNSGINAFLDHWRPDILLWGDQVFQTRVIQRGKARGLPMYLVNLPTLDLSRRFLRRSIAITLGHFKQALVTDQASANRLQELGFPAEKIRQMPSLCEVALPLPDDELRRKSLTAVFDARATWCAAFIRMDELKFIINAHKQAQKSIPGLGLIIVPAKGEPVDEMRGGLIDAGLSVQRVRKDAIIKRQSEVLLCEDGDETGIWYRMATVSFMGGSICGPQSADPFHAVALGSAVICGSITAPYQDKFRKMFMGEAVVSPDTAAQLGEVLIETLAPDRSATLAMAAWAVGSEGVDAVDAVVELAITALEQEGKG